MRSLCLLPLLLAGCDDHLFPKVAEDSYDPDWGGMQRLMADHCVACHSTQLPILPDAVEADVLAGGGTWVTPGDPTVSEFYLVMVHDSATYSPMPFAEEQLPVGVTDAVADWILDGALLE